VLRRPAHLPARNRTHPPPAWATVKFLPHMRSQSNPPSGTTIEVPGERAPANHLHTHRLLPIPEAGSIPISNPALRHRQVKRIAGRLASQPPHSDQNPGVRAFSVRKSLTLSPEIKTHTA
jgi:hypothetical protein